MKNVKEYKRINKIPIKYMFIMILAALSINILSLALPLTMKQIYSRIIVNKSTDTLILLMLGCLIALAHEAIIKKIKESSSKWISAKYESQLYTFLIKKILNSYEETSQKDNYNSNLEKFNSISRVTSFYSSGFYQIYIDLPFMFFFLYLIFYFGGWLVLAPIILSIIYIGISVVNARGYFNSRERQIYANDRLMENLTETLEKIHLVKAAGIEEFQIYRYRELLKQNTSESYMTNKYQTLPDTIAPYLSQLTMFSILLGGGFIMLSGGITFGEITACALLGGRAISPVISIMGQYLQHKDISLLRGRLDAIAYRQDRYDSNVPEFPGDIEGNIEFINVSYSKNIDSSKETITYKLNPGSFIYIDPYEYPTYRNIFNKLIGREKVEEGRILIDNLDINEWNMDSLKGKIEYLSDDISIFKGSIIDNITYFDQSKNAYVYEAAALTGLDDMISEMENGFETMLDTHAVNYLTSSFLQRLNITRALLGHPRIMIIDRIDEGMDKDTWKLFVEILEKFKGKITMLIATNNNTIQDMAERFKPNVSTKAINTASEFDNN